VADGNFDPSTIGRQEQPSSLELATQELNRGREESNSEFALRGLDRQYGIGGTGSYEGDSQARQDRIDDDSRGTIRVGGEMVSNNKENKEKRDLESRLKQEARDEGLSEAGVNDYVREKLEEQTREASDQAVQGVMDSLKIEKAEAELELKRQELIPNAPERPKANEIKSFISNAEDQFDLVFDSKTFTFSTVEDGGFWRSDKEHPLNPNSELYQKLKEVEGSEYFLSPPSDVLNFMEDSIQAAKQSPNGSVGVQADDGRVYNITAGGDITHVGYTNED